MDQIIQAEQAVADRLDRFAAQVAQVTASSLCMWRGRRRMTTFRKLPTTSPSNRAA